jgi:hypothetical protein
MTCLLQQGAFCRAAEETVKLESGLYYTVQDGDTLWDISQRFYNVPWVWPDLWQKNDQIANPHWIYPGEQVRLFWREKELSLLELPGAAEPEGPSVVRLPYLFYPAIDTVGFVRKQPVEPSGIIFSARGDRVMISDRDLVYIRPQGGAVFEAGDFFTVFRMLEPLRDEETGKLIGTQHRILGMARIMEVHPEYCLARVVQSFQTIQMDDLVMPYEQKSPKVTLVQGKEGLEGKIICAEDREILIGNQRIVFVDKGRQDGVEVGQSYDIYYQEKAYYDSQSKKRIQLAPVYFGKLVILHTEATTASALVTMAEMTISPGARIRSR